jgi:hypothetical protein
MTVTITNPPPRKITAIDIPLGTFFTGILPGTTSPRLYMMGIVSSGIPKVLAVDASKRWEEGIGCWPRSVEVSEFNEITQMTVV